MTPLTEVTGVDLPCLAFAFGHAFVAIAAKLLSQPNTESAVQFAFTATGNAQSAAVEILR